MESKKEDNTIILKLSSEKALVFLDWHTRFNEGEHPSLYEDQAEERILFDLESIIEESVSKTFDSNYQNILIEARAKLRDKE